MFGPYSVSVPLDFRAYDPARWAIMNAEDYEAALKIDPTLPDPASIGFGDAAALPPADPALLRDEAFVGPPAKPYVLRGVTALDRDAAREQVLKGKVQAAIDAHCRAGGAVVIASHQPLALDAVNEIKLLDFQP